jgi:esterase
MDLCYKKSGIGRPLIILHGLLGSSDNWYSISKALSDSFTVYCPDLRNHGRSPHCAEHNYDVLVDDLLHFITKNHIENPYFIGHSMGGKALMFFSLRYPELMSKMIIVDISPRSYKSLLELEPNSVELLNIMNALLSVDVKSLKSREEADSQLSVYLSDRNLRAFLVKNLQRQENGCFNWCFNLDVLYKNLPKMMEGLNAENTKGMKSKAETLFIRGRKSEYIGEKDIEPINHYFPNSTIETISDAGHWVHAEQPERFVKAVRRFLLSE